MTKWANIGIVFRLHKIYKDAMGPIMVGTSVAESSYQGGKLISEPRSQVRILLPSSNYNNTFQAFKSQVSSIKIPNEMKENLSKTNI